LVDGLGDSVEPDEVVLPALAKPPAKPSEFGPPVTAAEPPDDPAPLQANAPEAMATDITDARSNFFMFLPCHNSVDRPLRFPVVAAGAVQQDATARIKYFVVLLTTTSGHFRYIWI
jgi:hypothetical protein